jgi:4-hydroxy-2-oxoheptanedioate aldolase
VTPDNAQELLERGFRWLMSAPVPSFAGLEAGRRLAGRG